MGIRALIVEDEPLARRALRELVAEVDWLEAVGEAASGLEAVRMIDELIPDLIFLDVRMPGTHEVRRRARSALGRGLLRRLFGRAGSRIVPIPVREIVRIEAHDDASIVWKASQPLHLRMTLTELEQRLDGDRFQRVHRSHIVNLDQVAKMRPYDERRLVMTMRNGSEVIASRAGSQRLRHLAE